MIEQTTSTFFPQSRPHPFTVRSSRSAYPDRLGFPGVTVKSMVEPQSTTEIVKYRFSRHAVARPMAGLSTRRGLVPGSPTKHRCAWWLRCRRTRRAWGAVRWGGGAVLAEGLGGNTGAIQSADSWTTDWMVVRSGCRARRATNDPARISSC